MRGGGAMKIVRINIKSFPPQCTTRWGKGQRGYQKNKKKSPHAKREGAGDQVVVVVIVVVT